MRTSKIVRRWMRPARDFLLGMAVFAVIAICGMTDSGGPAQLLGGPAHARFEYPAVVSVELLPTDMPMKAPDTDSQLQLASTATLALAFAMLFALNLWFARHLRTVARSRVRAPTLAQGSDRTTQRAQQDR